MKQHEESIEVFAHEYCAFIDKKNAMFRFTNNDGITYSSFPLSIQFNSADPVSEDFSYRWVVENNKIIVEKRTQNDVLNQKINMIFRNSGFEIQFGLIPPTDHECGVFCGKRGRIGFDSSTWRRYFSPEPDEYYKEPPVVDVKAVNDKQWIFSPAPLNISVETDAGWFSVGLAELGPFTRFGMLESAIWLDIPWKKMNKSSGGLLPLSPLIFTINRSEWHAVADYRTYLEETDYLPAINNFFKPVEWWLQPVLSTRGERIVNKIDEKGDLYTSIWVKDYILKQMNNFEDIHFTIIISSKWQDAFGSAHASSRFSDLRQLVDWCHDKGHKVILDWRAWNAEATSLAQEMRVTDGDFIDATHEDFKKYIQFSCEMMLSSADTAYNADGIKISGNYSLRDPLKAAYNDSSMGIGMLELYAYMKAVYNQAKAIKPDALIIGEAQAPQFRDVLDVVCINEDWDDKLRREKRARIISQALPDKLILGDSADMAAEIACYHCITASAYGLPCIEYSDRFQNGAFSNEDRKVVSNLLKAHSNKGWGKAVFVDYGWWQWQNNDELKAESIAKGSALLYYLSKSEGLLISSKDGDVPFMLDGLRLLNVKTEAGKNAEWEQINRNIFKIKDCKKSGIYKLKFRRILR
ncbi:hypothetical protein JXJ21_10200 [candidate division KSB1 bacterium]|nr:hypothetical protein [candidate division KSB1 bacterium]